MVLFFYNLALLAVLVAGVPWWLWKMATARKYRAGLIERLGCVPARLKAAAARPVIWVHAVSVGEVLAASRLVEDMKRDFARALPPHTVLISTTTQTGHRLASARFGVEHVFYCPLDLPWAVHAYLDALRPHLLILVETEFWPNLLHGCFRRGIPVVVVNARISDRSWPRYRLLRGLWKPFLSRLIRIMAQTEADADRLRALGCLPERISVAGNLKFDVRAAGESEASRQLKARAQGLRLVVAGSTLEGEEAALLEAWPRLLAADSQLALVVAPRHPERFAAVAAILEKSSRKTGLSWVRRSHWPTGSLAVESAPARVPNAGSLGPGEIILLDTIGELASVYSLAAVAFVGGSLVSAGGHNPLEPAQFAVPIVMGPHYANFRAITEDLRARDAIRIAGKDNLAATLIELLENRPAAEAMGARAKTVFGQQAGATARCVQALHRLVTASAAAEYTA